ncbi:hypothetical protein AXFE_31770 [Acidithrix ferrooxidans]|uniref:Uncharacterized protein n=2 Tax=Acidithrix ferrooxidans TaxID=1280514 RepID=A0A0D8HFZ8_9ACTN|nr:hypothetical protein AXFE_31770 [Acidithrix ferrooxidans]
MFGNAPTHSSLSPLWPLAPSLYNVAIDYGSLKSLNLMGVGGLILGQKMATSYEVVDSSLPAPFGKNRQVTSALSALLGVYYSRPDLGAAFNLDSRSISLLKWATGISSGDSSYSRLHPNREIYLKVLSQEQSDPKISLFTSIDVASQWQYGGSVTFNGVRKFIYYSTISNLSSQLFVPTEIRPSGNSKAHPLISGDTTAYVTQNEISRNHLPKSQTNQDLILTSIHKDTDQTVESLVAKRQGFVVLFDQVMPGEHAFDNGVPIPLITTDGFLTGLVLHKGVNHIVLNYVSPWVMVIFWLDLSLNLILILAGGYLVLFKRFLIGRHLF